MHLLLREMLDNAGHELEFGFDNLFILKDSKTAQSPVQSFPLRNAIVNFYEKSEPHPVYHKIAALPFRAIVSCSPDLYLKKILDAKGIGSDFHFYSFNGNTTPSSNNEKNIIFNIFGSISHSQSLIISYDRFYDFIVSIMGRNYSICSGICWSSLPTWCDCRCITWFIDRISDLQIMWTHSSQIISKG